MSSILSLSLREDVKLRETENAWRPSRLKPTHLNEEETKTEALYKGVRSVLNKLTPEKFKTLIEQVRTLPIVARKGQGHPKISSRIRFMLQDVIDLRANKWIPRRDESNPKTIDQIQKELNLKD